MAVINENMLLSDVLEKNRFDAEYFDPDFVSNEKIIRGSLKGYRKLKQIAYITDGDHSIRKYVTSGVKFLTSENISEFIINYSTDKYLTTTYEKSLARSRSELHAVYLTKTGRYFGKAAICMKDSPVFNIPADIAKIRIYKNEFDPFFITAFLNSKIGYNAIRRENSGGTRDRIILKNLGNVEIPILYDIGLRKNIEEYILKIDISQSLYTQAQELLERELGLDKLIFDKPLSYETRLSEVVGNNRADADFHNPVLKEYYKYLSQKNDLVKITNYAKVLKFGNPTYSSTGIPIITQKHLQDISPNGYGSDLLADKAWVKKYPLAIIQENDLLFYSVGAYLGKTNIWLNEDKAVHASFITMLRCPREMDSGFLMVLLNSKYGILQSKVFQSGTSQQYIYPKDIRQFLVPEINDQIKVELFNLITGSQKAKTESQLLLEQAKRRIEELIEQAVQK